MVGFVIDEESTYRNGDGEPCVTVVLRPSEDGEFLTAFAAVDWSLGNPAHRQALTETLIQIQSVFKLVRFDLPKQKLVVPNIEIAVEDGTLSPRQLHRVLLTLIQVVKRYHKKIRRAIRDGIVPPRSTKKSTPPRPSNSGDAGGFGLTDESDLLNGPVSGHRDLLSGSDGGPLPD